MPRRPPANSAAAPACRRRDALAASETVEHREDVAQLTAEARQKRPQVPSQPRQRKKEAAQQARRHGLAHVAGDDQQGVFGAVGAVEVGETGVAAAVLADVVPDDEVGYHERAVEAAEEARTSGIHQQTAKATVTLCIFFSLLTDAHDDGRPLQPEHAADLIFQIPAIGEVEELFIVAEHHKKVGRRMPTCVIYRSSGGGPYPWGAAQVCASARTELSIPGGDPHGGLLPDVVDELEEPGDTLAGQGGDEHDGGA